MIISFDYIHRYGEAQKELAKWVKEGKLKRKYHIVDGLENAPSALPLLYNGGNTGKLWVCCLNNVNPLLILTSALYGYILNLVHSRLNCKR